MSKNKKYILNDPETPIINEESVMTTSPDVISPSVVDSTMEDTPIEKTSPVVEEEVKPIVKKSEPEVKYRDVVYLGISGRAERVGAVTGVKYVFLKDGYGMPVATPVNEKDYLGIISEKGKGCARRSPEILFMSLLEWNLELEQARIVNNS